MVGGREGERRRKEGMEEREERGIGEEGRRRKRERRGIGGEEKEEGVKKRREEG